ncbi:hypothetical protein DVH24_016745 [Malus domestica]|uniref:Chaperone DnaJ C-terminal domain-containing protein n=1 Tax=Malus domestica TaxID=3750 RepID=A0A498HYD2_MALDO|nr:hypothetical protein DVH24_016745 [Malus domestica]
MLSSPRIEKNMCERRNDCKLESLWQKNCIRMYLIFHNADGHGYPLNAKTKVCPTCRGIGREYCLSCRGVGIVEGVRQVDEDPIFSRDGADLYVDSSISFTQAILGGTVEVPTLSGKIEVKIPKGVQPGQHLVLRGKGN